MRGLVTALAFVRPGLSFLGSGVDNSGVPRWISGVAIFPCAGNRDEASERALAGAFAKGGIARRQRQGRIRDLVRGRGLLRMHGAQCYQPLSRCVPTKTCHVAVEPVTAGRCERFPIPTGRDSGRAGPRRHCIRLYRADDSWACATHFGQMNAIGGLRLYCGAASTGA